MPAPSPYVSILKAKEGEYKAFPDLAPATKQFILPLFEILSLDSEEDGGRVTSVDVDDHVTAAAMKLKKNLGACPLVLADLSLMDGKLRTSAGKHPLEELFTLLRSTKVLAAPVVSPRAGQAYVAAVAAAVAQDQRGMCIRVTADDLGDPRLPARIDQLLGATRTTPSGVHLVLDMGAIDASSERMILLTLRTVIPAFPRVMDWKTFTVAATGFPLNLSAIPADSEALIPRVEWRLWTALAGSALPRLPGFGDYGISHPELSDIDPRIMAMSANIRYTVDGQWLILKGRNVRRFGYEQFPELCRSLVKRPEYSGKKFSAADAFISECAAGNTGTGNPTTWRWVGNVHHLTLVARALANFP